MTLMSIGSRLQQVAIAESRTKEVMISSTDRGGGCYVDHDSVGMLVLLGKKVKDVEVKEMRRMSLRLQVLCCAV